MDLEVWVETVASDAEIEAVKQVVADAGLDVDVEPRALGRGSGPGDLGTVARDFPWAVFVVAPSTAVFLAAFAKAAGNSMGSKIGDAAGNMVVAATSGVARTIASLATRLYRRRTELSPRPGHVVLYVKDRQLFIVLPDEMSEAAAEQLLGVIDKLRSPDRVVWDETSEQWLCTTDRKGVGRQAAARRRGRPRLCP